MAWACMLECSDGSYDVGSTADLGARLAQHAGGTGALYTGRRRPVQLVSAQEFDRLDEAFAFEKRIQGWGRAKRRALAEGWLDDLDRLNHLGRGGASRWWG